MGVENVRFGQSYAVGNFGPKPSKKDEKSEEMLVPNTGVEEKAELNPDKMFDALNITGLQNKSQIDFVGKREVNPADYLDEARMSDIEAMMEQFAQQTELYANEVQEYGFSEAQSNALGAQAFARDINNADVIISQE